MRTKTTPKIDAAAIWKRGYYAGLRDAYKEMRKYSRELAQHFGRQLAREMHKKAGKL